MCFIWGLIFDRVVLHLGKYGNYGNSVDKITNENHKAKIKEATNCTPAAPCLHLRPLTAAKRHSPSICRQHKTINTITGVTKFITYSNTSQKGKINSFMTVPNFKVSITHNNFIIYIVPILRTKPTNALSRSQIQTGNGDGSNYQQHKGLLCYCPKGARTVGG
jgi:hypothetical protein